VKLRCEATPWKLPPKTAKEVLRLDRIAFSEDAATDLEDCWWWVIRNEKGRGVAFAGLRGCRHPSNKGLAYMDRSGVTPKHRGKGLQKRLIKARISMARRHGYKEIVTYVLAWNLASANSLIGCGFKLYHPAEKYAGSKAFYFRCVISPLL